MSRVSRVRPLFGTLLPWVSRTAMRARVRGRFTAGATALLAACSSEAAAPAVPRVASVTIVPAVDTVDVPLTRAFIATARDANGNTASGSLTWQVSDTMVATSAPAGVTCRNVGNVRLTATVDGVNATADLACRGVFTVVPELPSLFPGDTLQLDVRLATRGGTTLVPLGAWPITWRRAPPGWPRCHRQG